MKLILAIKALGDLLLVHAGYIAAFHIRFGTIPERNWEAYIYIVPWLTIAALILFYSYGFYRSASVRQQWDEIFSGLVCALSLLMLVTVTLSFILYLFALPRLTIFMAAGFQFLFILGWRLITVRWTDKYVEPLKIIIVGPEESAMERARFFQSGQNGHYHVLAILVDQKTGADETLPVYQGYAHLAAVIDELYPNSVIFCPGIPEKPRMQMLTQAIARDINIFIVPDIYDILVARSRLEQLNSVPAFRVSAFSNGRELLWKRVTDITFAVIFGLPAIILVLFASIALKIELFRAPVFYSQERVSRHGRIFKLYKLRTMVPDAEKSTGPVLSASDDQRVTAVGRVLRLTRVDELPQIWNVLKGEMSFIGPRAERPFFVDQYCRSIPGYDYRHIVNSGITGLAQVEGKYSTTAEDKLRFDLIYVQTFSPLRDFHILMHTVKVMLLKKKAM